MTTWSVCGFSLGRGGVRTLLLATPLLLATSAYADTISVGFQQAGVNGGAIHTVGTGAGNEVIPGISYGTFTVNDVSVQDFAVLGSPGLLNTQTLDISSSTAGTLTIYITAQGLSFTGAQNFASSFAVNTLSGSIVAVEESTYFSPKTAYTMWGKHCWIQRLSSTSDHPGPLLHQGVRAVPIR